MAVYIQKGDRIDYKNETEAVIKSGDVVALEGVELTVQ